MISGSVTVPSSRSVPRGLPVRSVGPGHVEHVVEDLERQADPGAELAERVGALGPRRAEQRAQPARGLEQPRRLQLAALEVAVARHVAPTTRRRAASARRARATRTRATAPRPPRARRPTTSSANARENSRSPVAVAASRPPSANTVGRPAPQRRPVEHVVVDERRHVKQLDRGRRADQHVARRRRPRTGRRASAAAACRRPTASRRRAGPARRRGSPPPPAAAPRCA